MNLFDLIKRKDRSIVTVKGSVESETYIFYGKKYNSVRMVRNSYLRILNANEFYLLRTLPKAIGWKLQLDGTGAGHFKIFAASITGDLNRKLLFEQQLLAGDTSKSVLLDWSVLVDSFDCYNIEIEYAGEADLIILINEQINIRKSILSQIQGVGVEVGPGLNPHILPTSKIEVKYIESVPAEKWVELYKKQDKPNKVALNNLWDSYIVSNAHFLESIEDKSLNFIFSNHVFEHLVNPLGVLKNWTRKLKNGGVIAGVIPDCRYTFDIRQSPSSILSFNDEFIAGKFDINHEKYLRWCKYTAPYNTPADLVRRQYSIHVHYYTPDRFADLVEIFMNKQQIKSLFIDTFENNKDFAFQIRF